MTRRISIILEIIKVASLLRGEMARCCFGIGRQYFLLLAFSLK